MVVVPKPFTGGGGGVGGGVGVGGGGGGGGSGDGGGVVVVVVKMSCRHDHSALHDVGFDVQQVYNPTILTLNPKP